MRKILFFVFSTSLLFSCNNREIKKVKCVVTYCKKINNPIKSAHDEINIGNIKWKVKTSCGSNTFITKEPYQIGDTVTATLIKYL